jgi:hypothetical protein
MPAEHQVQGPTTVNTVMNHNDPDTSASGSGSGSSLLNPPPAKARPRAEAEELSDDSSCSSNGSLPELRQTPSTLVAPPRFHLRRQASGAWRWRGGGRMRLWNLCGTRS